MTDSVATPVESSVCWNIVFTPGTFRYFRLFTRSLLANTDARVRLVANGCSRDEIGEMCAFTDGSAGRITLLVLPGEEMTPHGFALTTVFDATDDGDLFCFVDSDVKARTRFMPVLLEALGDHVAVTSGDVAWSDDTTLPAGARDVVGRHAVGADGFVYGSSYLAMYRRAAVTRVRDDWGVTFAAYGYTALPRHVQAGLDAQGRRFDLYDTAKVLNILLQAGSDTVVHIANPDLFHVGGISQYLSHLRTAGTDRPPWYARRGSRRVRWDFAGWAAATLAALVDGGEPPDPSVEGVASSQLATTSDELRDLVARYRDAPA
jgi:hypothetical protein